MAPIRNVRLTLAYDGTNYCGWHTRGSIGNTQRCGLWVASRPRNSLASMWARTLWDAQGYPDWAPNV